MADVAVQRVHERQAWEAAQRDLAAERASEDQMQRQESGGTSLRSDQLSPQAIAEELGRMEEEMSPADRATFRQQLQQQGPGVTISIERSRERGWER